MKLEEYNIYCDDVARNLFIKRDEIFNPEFSPFLEEFLKLFEFYKSSLETQSKLYGIDSSYIFINCLMDKNAKACLTEKGQFFIEFNAGLIVWLILNIKLNNEIKIGKDPVLVYLLENLDVGINELMYQCSMHFTFYHEFAHLIQFNISKRREFYLESINDQKELFEFERHLAEIDADSFSAVTVGTHLMIYYNRVFGDILEVEVLENMCLIIGISFSIYLMSFDQNNEGLYFDEKTHPHPFIRLNHALLTFIRYISQDLNVPKEFAKKVVDLVVRSIREAEHLEKELLNSNQLGNVLGDITEKRVEIRNYLYKLNKGANNGPHFALNIRNSVLKERGQ